MDISPPEQLMIELVNRGRMDPRGEAARFGIDLNKGLPAGTIDPLPKPPLAQNDLLTAAARGHSQWMVDTDTFGHTGKDGSDPTARIRAAGYLLTGTWATGENIALVASTGAIDAAEAIRDEHKNLFLSAGHRSNMMSRTFQEIGIGQAIGPFVLQGTAFNASLVTQNYALSGSSVFVTGVVYTDTDGDVFYSPGEGKSGTSFAAAGTTASSEPAGGYALQVPNSTASPVTVTVRQGARTYKAKIAIKTGNAKLDVVGGSRFETSADLTLISGITGAQALGVGPVALTGSAAPNDLVGNAGKNRIDGKGGADRIAGKGGADRLTGGDGPDDFVFDTAIAAGATDTVIDFAPGVDTIRLARSVFKAVPKGTLPTSAFGTGSAAATTAQRVLYDPTTGKLAYDADGKGGAAAKVFAVLASKPALKASDVEGF